MAWGIRLPKDGRLGPRRFLGTPLDTNPLLLVNVWVPGSFGSGSASKTSKFVDPGFVGRGWQPLECWQRFKNFPLTVRAIIGTVSSEFWSQPLRVVQVASSESYESTILFGSVEGSIRKSITDQKIS